MLASVIFLWKIIKKLLHLALKEVLHKTIYIIIYINKALILDKNSY